MCLATVYKENTDSVVMENTARIDVDGEYLVISDILGEETRIKASIQMVDLANSVVRLKIDE
ncbi:MAG: CooT family nickel-binding protein [Eubacterium sp.]|nr:CooT family nickel-binding protein [Eubacterium sp.]